MWIRSIAFAIAAFCSSAHAAQGYLITYIGEAPVAVERNQGVIYVTSQGFSNQVDYQSPYCFLTIDKGQRRVVLAKDQTLEFFYSWSDKEYSYFEVHRTNDILGFACSQNGKPLPEETSIELLRFGFAPKTLTK